jgi:hypothetical protein
MVVMELPDGSTGEYALDDSDRALRLVSHYASFDLMTALSGGWRIRDVTTERERELVVATHTLFERPRPRAVRNVAATARKP